jgi:hypothetical protein
MGDAGCQAPILAGPTRLGDILAMITPGYALVAAVTAIGYLTATYVAALIWWRLAATALTVREAAPEHFLTRWLAQA